MSTMALRSVNGKKFKELQPGVTWVRQRVDQHVGASRFVMGTCIPLATVCLPVTSHPSTRGNRVIVLLSPNLGARKRWVVNATPGTLSPRERTQAPTVEGTASAQGHVWMRENLLLPSVLTSRTFWPVASRPIEPSCLPSQLAASIFR